MRREQVASQCGLAGLARAGEVGGSDRGEALGQYGTRGVRGSTNVPGARDNGASWIDGDGGLWLFGGYGVDAVGAKERLNDLWSYQSATGAWTWEAGSDRVGAPGFYGTRGVLDVANEPPARNDAMAWVDSSGRRWLFGGVGTDGVTTYLLNDLWMYDQASARWTWVHGSAGRDAPPAYGTLGVAAPQVTPGARDSSAAGMGRELAPWCGAARRWPAARAAGATRRSPDQPALLCGRQWPSGLPYRIAHLVHDRRRADAVCAAKSIHERRRVCGLPRLARASRPQLHAPVESA